MQDRFKFRAWVKVYYYDKDDNDKSLNLKFDDIDVMQNGFIGFSLEQLREVLDKTSLTEEEKESVIDYLNENNSTYTDDAYLISWGTVEQCTGIKDSDGKLIYEGDVVEDYINDVRSIYCLVYWDRNQWCIKNESTWDDTALEDNNVLIVGNIHENPELLGE